MAFKNPIATFLFIFLHETPFQFARRIARDWEMRKRMRGESDSTGTLASGEGGFFDEPIAPHDDDRLIPGCDSVLMCERSGRWIELGGEG